MRIGSLILGALLATTLAACQRQTVCAAGATQPCVCTDGRPGAQFCSRDGMGWGPCQCTGPAVQPSGGVPDPLLASPAVPSAADPAVGAPAAARTDPLLAAPVVPPAPLPEPAPNQQPPELAAGGRRTPSDIQNVIRRDSSAVRRCYERGLADDPSLEGRLTVQLGIVPQGTVASASILSDELRNPTVTGCILRTFRQLRFPTTTEPGLQTVTYPLVFNGNTR